MKHYFEQLQHQIVLNWDRDALCDYTGDRFTFGDMASRIAKLHLLFKALGVHPGARICICARNQARWGISFLAVNTYEAVAVPILPDFTPESISSIINHSESVMLFADEDIWKSIASFPMPSLRLAVCISDFRFLKGSGSDEKIFGALDETFVKKYPSELGVRDIHYPTANDKNLAVINYTSGSTGNPKGVMLRYECFSANIEYGQKMIPNGPGDTILSILPMAHMFGMAFELLYPLCGGVTVWFLGKAPSPTLLMNAMKHVRPYLVLAVPMIFEKLYRSRLMPVMNKPAVKCLMRIPGIRSVLYSRMRHSLDEAFGGKVRQYVLGGAGLNQEVEEFLKKIGLHFTVGYGMTEAAPLMAYETWNKLPLRSCGKAMDYVELRIDSENSGQVVGEIQAKGLNLFSGYFKNDEATSSSFTSDGWFNTGDLGLIDAEGYVYIKGRNKSMLISSNGQNIYPEEVESEINSVPYVIESLVVSRDGKLVALLHLDEDSAKAHGRDIAALADEIVAKANARLPKYSRLASAEVMREPFRKTPKMSIKRFLYK